MLATLLVGVAMAVPPQGAKAEMPAVLGLPVACDLGADCFVQQMPDVDPGPGITDPLCGRASYDGHDGWDIRLRSLADIADDVSVVAIADGRVLRTRDGQADRIVKNARERAEQLGRECGNGVVIAHAGGLVSQYCHLKRGSVVARSGTAIRKGDRLGSIGASGLAQFPHVHLSVRRNDTRLDPLTGRPLKASPRGCGDLSASLFSEEAGAKLARSTATILKIGLANAPPTLDGLLLDGGPRPAKAGGATLLAWVWAINIEAGDRFSIRVVRPDGAVLVDRTTEPVPRRKANFLVYAGRRGRVANGTYLVDVKLVREGKPVVAAKQPRQVD